MNKIVTAINEFEQELEHLSDEQLSGKTGEFAQRLEAGSTLNSILPEAFAVVREASKRTLGLRHFDVQMIGGIVLNEGNISEMRTGEGKTLVATLPLRRLPGLGGAAAKALDRALQAHEQQRDEQECAGAPVWLLRRSGPCGATRLQ